jgi:hypothetical protein
MTSQEVQMRFAESHFNILRSSGNLLRVTRLRHCGKVNDANERGIMLKDGPEATENGKRVGDHPPDPHRR